MGKTDPTIYVRFETARDCLVGPTYGPYDYVQVTYKLLKGGSQDGRKLIRAVRQEGRQDEETELATFEVDDGNWHLVDDEERETVFTDFVIFAHKKGRI